MAKKATLTPVTDTVNNAGAINTQLNAINDKLDNTLSLDGSAPNSMQADIDLNNNDLLNIGTINGSDATGLGPNLDAVAAISGDVAAVSAIAADVTTNAANIVAIQNAAANAASAAADAASAAASFDSFDDRYLGSKVSEPTVDNDGDPLLEGALYWNSTSNQMFIYNGVAFETAAISSINPSFTSMTVSGNISLSDNNKIIFGAGNDLEIFHDGVNSYINDVGTGSLYIKGSSDMSLQSATGETYFNAIADGATTLYHNNASKVATTATGATVTGTVTADGLTVDTNTLHVDSANNRVGIANLTPTTALDVTGTITGTNVTATATVSGATVSSTGNVTATGTVSGATVTATGTVSGATVTATGTVSGATVSSAGGVTATGAVSGANVTATGYVKTGATVVASLPAAATAGAGARHFVTDANATTFASVVAGGGANAVPVYSDGTDWRIG